MDRTPEPTHLHLEALPPFSPRFVFTLQMIGFVVCALTALTAPFGGTPPGLLSTVALSLLAVGLPLSGYALSLRPGDWRAWALAAATALLASFGFPRHWDDGAMVCRVIAVVLTTGTLLCRAQPTARYGVLTALLAFHYGAFLMSTTSPDPRPWTTNQLLLRVYVPYYQFCYFSNAYHFYSPEPGPASLLFFLITYELDAIDPQTGKPKLESAWLDLPNRATQFKDPLGLTYQRRLSITELVAQTAVALPDNFENNDAANRRRAAAVNLGRPQDAIPLMPGETLGAQYRLPTPATTRYLLPAYARHIAATYSTPGRRVVSVKMVRVEHRVIPPQAFLHQVDPETGIRREEGESPYSPRTYRPYYLGEYAPNGDLVNPTDPLLYWLLPLVPRNTPNEQGRYFDDYLSRYLKHEYPWTGGFKGTP